MDDLDGPGMDRLFNDLQVRDVVDATIAKGGEPDMAAVDRALRALKVPKLERMKAKGKVATAMPHSKAGRTRTELVRAIKNGDKRTIGRLLDGAQNKR